MVVCFGVSFSEHNTGCGPFGTRLCANKQHQFVKFPEWKSWLQILTDFKLVVRELVLQQLDDQVRLNQGKLEIKDEIVEASSHLPPAPHLSNPVPGKKTCV